MEEIKRILRKFLRRRKPKLFTVTSLHSSEKEHQESNPYTPSFSEENKTSKQKNWKNWIKILFLFLLGSGVLIGSLILGWIFYIASQAPDLQEIEANSFNQSGSILASDGYTELYSLHGEENRAVVTLEQISPAMQDAILAAEDAKFYEHTGVSFTGIARAFLNGIQGRPTGGSTITQQLIKMVVFAKGEETMKEKVERKIKEIALTRKLEKKYSKDRILELYLNKSPFGRNAYGVEMAAQAYFGKSAQNLSITESAILAGLPQSPSRYARNQYSYIDMSTEEIEKLNIQNFSDLMSREYSIKRSFIRGIFGSEVVFADGEKKFIPGRFDFVLGQMRDKNFITEEEFNIAQEEAKTIEIKKMRADIKAPHFVHYVEEEAESILQEKLGEEYDKNILQSGGLKIYTSLDYELQQELEEILEAQAEINAEYKIRNGAVLVMNPKTGEIIAMLGSRDYYGTYLDPETGKSLSASKTEMQERFPDLSAEEIDDLKISGKVNVITSLRQPGSTFKPISYAAGFEYSNLSPASVLMDVETDFGQKYIPKNFDGKFRGPVSLRKSLGNSFNISAIKVGIIAGLSKVYELGSSLGIEFSKDIDYYGSAISLGSAEVKPIEMGLAYSSFANGGKKISPVAILKIVNAEGKIIYEHNFDQEKEQVLQPETAYLITDILSDGSGNARPASWNKTLSIPNHTIAAKTGTSTVKTGPNKILPHDAWTIGFSAQRTVVVWTGNNKGWKDNPKGALSNTASGLKNAGPIFQKTMVAVHKNLEPEEFKKPSGIKEIRVSKLSGKIPPNDFPKNLITKDIFNTSAIPSQIDTSLQVISLVDSSKKLPNEFTPQKAIKDFVYIDLHSYFPDRKEWEEPVQKWIDEHREEFTTQLNVPGDIISYLPTELDGQYTQENSLQAPQVTITSPANMGIISPPYLNIEVDPSAENGISYLEFFWNGELMETKRSAPWTTRINLGEQKIGSTHTITVKATDRSLYEGETSIQVKIGEDTIPPEINIVYPTVGKTLSSGDLIEISANAIDRNSAIAKVEFLLDEKPVKRLLQMPFSFAWKVAGEEKMHILKAIATDQSGNVNESMVSFFIQESTNNQENPDNTAKNKILRISNTTPLGNLISNISFEVPKELRTATNTLEINAKKAGSRRLSIFSISGDTVPASGNINFSHTFPEAGNYEVYIKVKGENNTSSQKVQMSVE